MSIDPPPPLVVPHALCFVPRPEGSDQSTTLYNIPIHASSVVCLLVYFRAFAGDIYIYYPINTVLILDCPFFRATEISYEIHLASNDDWLSCSDDLITPGSNP
jgi:hypothetical protein